MRKIDEGKKNRIKQAVFEIARDEGIAGLSFGKLAKRAGVSSGTPYVYYQDKTDMLGKIYLDVKTLVDEGLQADIDQGKTPEERLFNAVNHFAKQLVAHQLEANYLAAIEDNPQLVTAAVLQAGNQLAAPLKVAFEAAAATGRLKTTNPETVMALLFGPFTMVLRQRFAIDQPVLASELETVIQFSMQGLLKDR
ncbi:TetR/AcrR family transcriptional regulator [Lactiplantibacillus pingfangensis]|uniref:TetR/AcrR family transcriptional regulator n=1 Tax=Lactiplantibacillus pingfangensis TaxID=2559915 RepID=UPI001484FFBD|nr:TetR/AcrR family transcriptional regulator [Lactiplantibacillus pingfangensis]